MLSSYSNKKEISWYPVLYCIFILRSILGNSSVMVQFSYIMIISPIFVLYVSIQDAVGERGTFVDINNITMKIRIQITSKLHDRLQKESIAEQYCSQNNDLVLSSCAFGKMYFDVFGCKMYVYILVFDTIAQVFYIFSNVNKKQSIAVL